MTSRTPISHNLNGVEFRLAEQADLSFIREYGRVFRVFDDNDSGNISFGVDDGSRKRFIKLAGVRTVNAGSSPGEAVALLRRAAEVYDDIVHPNIVRCIGSIDHSPYFGLVFEWVEGELLRRIYEQPFTAFRSLPVRKRLAAFDTVIDVMQHIHHVGYVAVDLYDASFLYDFDREHLTVCDIDVFERKPIVNSMGRMWGSSRFMSPEEVQLGAEIDEITNVYTLGAIAFLFFGDERDRRRGLWDAGDGLFDIGLKATSANRDERYQSIVAFAEAWRRWRRYDTRDDTTCTADNQP